MKNFALLIGLILISASTFASTLNLSGGDIVTINPGQETTVTCGGTGAAGNCADASQALKTQIEACADYTHGQNWCIQKFWPTFTQNSASCIPSALKICLDACSDYTHSSNWCVTQLCK